MLKELKEIKEVVHELLIKYPECRDNDNLLVLKVWGEQNEKLRSKDYSFREFATNFISKEYVSTESVRRASQLIRAKYPELQSSKVKYKKIEAENIREYVKIN